MKLKLTKKNWSAKQINALAQWNSRLGVRSDGSARPDDLANDGRAIADLQDSLSVRLGLLAFGEHPCLCLLDSGATKTLLITDSVIGRLSRDRQEQLTNPGKVNGAKSWLSGRVRHITTRLRSSEAQSWF
jgi:stalled ribosome rescue protein Dom34